jgi:hypothetical protein
MDTNPLLDAAACERAAVYAYHEGNLARHEWLKLRAEELRDQAGGHRPADPPNDADSPNDAVTDGDA